jgi:hypothetical protein
MSAVQQVMFMNQRSFGSGWLVKSSGGTASAIFKTTSDSAGKTYAVGYITTATTQKLSVSRFTSTGTADLNVALTGPSFPYGSDTQMGISVDSSGFIYTVGQNVNAPNSNGVRTAKWSSAGGLQYQFSTAGNRKRISPENYVIDSSGNTFVALYCYEDFGGCLVYLSPAIIKYNSSGGVVWSNYYNLTTINRDSKDIALDTSGNVWIVGYQNFIRTNSSGSATLFRTTSSIFFGISIDSSNNIYITGKESFAAHTILCNLSTAGVINWQRKFTLFTTMNATSGVDVDSAGNIYYIGTGQNASGPGYTFILKYNSSGILQWQRTLTVGTTASNYAYGTDLKVVGDNVNIVGRANSTGSAVHGFAISVPTSGGLTGTIVNAGANYLYAVASGTETAGVIATLTTQPNSTTNLAAANTATSLTTETNQLTNTTTTF